MGGEKKTEVHLVTDGHDKKLNLYNHFSSSKGQARGLLKKVGASP